MNFKIDIKLLITFLALAVAFGGFYYTTQMRLDRIEVDLKEPTHDCHVLKKQVQNLSKRVRKLENK